MLERALDPLNRAASLSANTLLAAASGDVLGSSLRILRRGERLDANEGVVWFPVDAVVRAETASGLLEGWTDRHGAIGLAELLDRPESSTTWVVERSGEALVTPASTVQAMLERSIGFQRAVMAWLVRSEHAARRRAAFNLTASAPEKVRRVVDFILSFHDGCAPITQEQVATYTGIRRTTVCAAMGAMQAQGQIVVRRGKILRPVTYSRTLDTGRGALL
ncbi:MAG: Crp/Fnr family transcriptional regulator [Brevundimonas sp.]|nr:MAG: Crp/Fnr family transcriptional regulator [Brevundimonas sp.]